MSDGIKKISGMNQRAFPSMPPEVLARKVNEAQVLLVDLYKVNPDQATELGMRLDSDPRNVDYIIREAEGALGQLTQVRPERSGVIVGTSRFLSRAIDRCSLGRACDQLAQLSHAEFAALRMANQTTGSDFRGEVLFPDVMKGVWEMLG